ncbi:MAG: class I SAM-dependent methyltransferase [Patescibacteria group bacterium]|jgi:ubiquinone/menaquinone biosynthesis C-methylase UbiE
MAFYDHYDYQRYWRGREYEHEAETLALKRLFAQIPLKKQKTLLDIGAGFGRITPFYADKFSFCLLVEPAKRLINQAKKNLKYQNLKFKQGQAENLELSEKFDVVLFIRVAHHIKNLDLVLKNINHHLKSDGYLILEFANKINFKAKIKAIFRGNFSFLKEESPYDRRSPANLNQETILFLNHHPKKINQSLKRSDFEIIDRLSVSNFRLPILKKIIPTGILLWGEKLFQPILAKINFGPSIFLLAKVHKSHKYKTK